MSAVYAHEPVNRYMTEAVLFVELTAPSTEIIRLLAGYPVHHLPVVERTKVVGMLGLSDVLKLKRFLPRLGSKPLDYLSKHLQIEQIMRQPAITIRPHQSIEMAAKVMAEHGIHSLPVTDDQEHLLGIITTTDIIFGALHLDQRASAHSPNTSGPREPPVQVMVSPAELDEALRLAAAGISLEDDNGKLARALLHSRSRLNMLENVLGCAERYVQAGQDEHLHALLLKAIQKARASSSPTEGRLGL